MKLIQANSEAKLIVGLHNFNHVTVSIARHAFVSAT